MTRRREESPTTCQAHVLHPWRHLWTGSCRYTPGVWASDAQVNFPQPEAQGLRLRECSTWHEPSPPLQIQYNKVVLEKARSYFMPNNITPRYDVAEMCNPTHSTAVNKLCLKAVIKKEAARVGHPSQARRVSQSPSMCTGHHYTVGMPCQGNWRMAGCIHPLPV